MPLEDGLGESGKRIDPVDPVGHVGRIDANNHIGHIFHCSVDPGVCWDIVWKTLPKLIVTLLGAGLRLRCPVLVVVLVGVLWWFQKGQ